MPAGATNLGIMTDVAKNLARMCPDALMINIANPLDAMVYALKRSPRRRAKRGGAGFAGPGTPTLGKPKARSNPESGEAKPKPASGYGPSQTKEPLEAVYGHSWIRTSDFHW